VLRDRAGTIRQVQALYDGAATAGLSDAQLLERFVRRDGDVTEAAFAALVERHGPMVLGLCRRILGDPHEAQDAFQATFLVLARKAETVTVEGSLGPWLHGVGFRVAQRARVVALRRRIRETPLSIDIAQQTEECRDDCEALHAELDRLPPAGPAVGIGIT